MSRLEIAYSSISSRSGTLDLTIHRLFKISKIKLLELVANFYISVIQGMPLLVQILFIYFGFPVVFGFKWSLDVAGIVIMSLNAGAYMAGLVRGGIESVEKGQMEAARSLGMSFGQAMWKVILLQALRTMLPSIINQFIVTLKGALLLSVIGFRELIQDTKIIVANNMEIFTMYFIVGVYINGWLSPFCGHKLDLRFLCSSKSWEDGAAGTAGEKTAYAWRTNSKQWGFGYAASDAEGWNSEGNK